MLSAKVRASENYKSHAGPWAALIHWQPRSVVSLVRWENSRYILPSSPEVSRLQQNLSADHPTDGHLSTEDTQ